MNAPTQSDLDWLFQYHPPRDGQPERYQAIRTAGRAFAQAVYDNVGPGPDQSAAYRLIREAVFTANAGIATETVVTTSAFAKRGQVQVSTTEDDVRAYLEARQRDPSRKFVVVDPPESEETKKST